MKYRLVLVLLPLLSFIQTAQAETAYKLSLLTENYPPLSMTVSGKRIGRGEDVTGISVDIVNEMMKRANISNDLALRFPWSKIYNMTLAKDDHALFSTTRTPDRVAFFKWVGPIVSSEIVVFAKKSRNIKITSLDDLSGYKIGSFKGDIVEKTLAENGIPVSLTIADENNAKKLKRDGIDLWATHTGAGYYFAKKYNLPDIEVVYTLSGMELYLALNKNIPDHIVNRLQSALDSMKQDGTFESIQQSYR